MRKTHEQGQSLLEVIIALSIAALIVVGLARVSLSAIRSSRFSQDQSLVTSLGQKMLSLMESEKNTDPERFWPAVEACQDTTDGCNHSLQGYGFENFVGEYCYVMKVANAYSLLPLTTPNYANAKMAKIMVDVYWEEKGAGLECQNKIFSHKVHLESYVTN